MKVEAYMCDRCGALFLEPGKDWNFTHKEPESKTESRKIDFCKDCMSEFQQWISFEAEQ